MVDHPADDPSGSTPGFGGRFSPGDPSDDVRWVALRSALGFAAIAGLIAVDLISDASAGIELKHVLLEGLVLGLAVAGVAVLWRTALRARRQIQTLRGEISAWRVEAERWRTESRALLQGLGVAMEQQFERWELSPAEREVALLLVKGLSLNEIARLRTTSERTARQQSQAVYRKAGLAGRAELSAFFLEDLLLPSVGSGSVVTS
jgi:DNA-binding CsgD family transcriptional regulator